LEQNEPFSTLKTVICWKYSFQKQTQFSQEDNPLDAATSHTNGLLSRDMCFNNSAELAYLQQIETFSTLKNLICTKYSLQNLSQFSQGNNVQDAAASNIDGFLWTDTCVPSTLLNNPILSNKTLSPP
jgi:hypothetical protein